MALACEVVDVQLIAGADELETSEVGEGDGDDHKAGGGFRMEPMAEIGPEGALLLGVFQTCEDGPLQSLVAFGDQSTGYFLTNPIGGDVVGDEVDHGVCFGDCRWWASWWLNP